MKITVDKMKKKDIKRFILISVTYFMIVFILTLANDISVGKVSLC